MSAHGMYRIVLADNIIMVEIKGTFNAEGVNAYI